jgi:hypothetical protein
VQHNCTRAVYPAMMTRTLRALRLLVDATVDRVFVWALYYDVRPRAARAPRRTDLPRCERCAAAAAHDGSAKLAPHVEAADPRDRDL